MIEDPFPLAEAMFTLARQELSVDAAGSLAALHLGTAQMMYPEDEWVQQQFSADTELEWPRILPASEVAITGAELGLADKQAGSISMRNGVYPGGAATRRGELRRALFGENPSEARPAAMALALANMSHPNSLVKVTAAVATLSFARNPVRLGQAFSLLSRAYADPELNDDLIRQLAFVGLSRAFLNGASSVAKDLGTRMARFLGVDPAGPVSVASNSTVLVHGTVFDRHGKPQDEWWRPPSGDLHQYLKAGVRPNLYCGPDHYRWSGGWSDYAREEAAEKLVEWLSHRGLFLPDVIAHSHGCNVAMLASQITPFNQLVLLSCPVHWSAYHPGRVNKTISIRIKWDLVIMADGGAQRFPQSSGIQEEILPFWFTAHDTSRRSSTWSARSLDSLL
ncbi:MAG: hypothetical protein V4794_13225 [Pseudomonadota bacterium]